jgi:hypothetical protein
MYDFFRIGEEVIFQSLSDLHLIVEGVNEVNGGIRCKYFDDNLKRYIKLTLPADSLIPHRHLPAGGAKKTSK